MSAVPVIPAVTIPVFDPTVATDVLLLLHVPVAGRPEIIVVVPKQTCDGPDIAVGREFTTTGAVTTQPVGAI